MRQANEQRQGSGRSPGRRIKRRRTFLRKQAAAVKPTELLVPGHGAPPAAANPTKHGPQSPAHAQKVRYEPWLRSTLKTSTPQSAQAAQNAG